MMCLPTGKAAINTIQYNTIANYCVDEANDSKENSNVLYETYHVLYNSVPAGAHKWDDLHKVVHFMKILALIWTYNLTI